MGEFDSGDYSIRPTFDTSRMRSENGESYRVRLNLQNFFADHGFDQHTGEFDRPIRNSLLDMNMQTLRDVYAYTTHWQLDKGVWGCWSMASERLGRGRDFQDVRNPRSHFSLKKGERVGLFDCKPFGYSKIGEFVTPAIFLILNDLSTFRQDQLKTAERSRLNFLYGYTNPVMANFLSQTVDFHIGTVMLGDSVLSEADSADFLRRPIDVQQRTTDLDIEVFAATDELPDSETLLASAQSIAPRVVSRSRFLPRDFSGNTLLQAEQVARVEATYQNLSSPANAISFAKHLGIR